MYEFYKTEIHYDPTSKYRSMDSQLETNLKKLATPLGFDTNDLVLACQRSGSDGQAILKFLNELYAIKYEVVYYLTAKICTTTHYGINSSTFVYKLLSPEDMAKYTKIVQTFKNIATNLDEDLVVRIDNGAIIDLQIRKMYKCDGNPKNRDYYSKEITKEQENLLEQIPSSPRELFVNISRFVALRHTFSVSTSFRATTDSLQNLFTFTISTKNKNYIEYMGFLIELTAGRGDIWYLRMSNQDELNIMKNIFKRYTTPDANFSDSDESDESDEST